MEIEKVKLVSKISPTETLRAMEIGIPVLIPRKYMKIYSIRTAATKLKSQGYEFSITEKGLIDDALVTRLR